MATDQMNTERSRRGLLVAAAGATAAAAAATVARAIPTQAADGQFVRVGSAHEGENVTSIKTTDTWAIHGESDSARGVMGTSNTGQGVHGASVESAGVAGTSETGNGVRGTSTSNRGVWGESTSGTGVVGAGTTGVSGSGDKGVHGSGSSVGVLAESGGGYAVHSTAGRVRFDGISGIAVIPAGQTKVTITPSVPVGGHSMVLLTPHVNLNGKNIWYSIPSGGGSFNVNINEVRNNDTRIAYLLLDHAAQ